MVIGQATGQTTTGQDRGQTVVSSWSDRGQLVVCGRWSVSETRGSGLLSSVVFRRAGGGVRS